MVGVIVNTGMLLCLPGVGLASFQFALDVLFADGGALVVFLLAFGEGDVEFGVAVFAYESTHGDDGEAFGFDLLGEVAQFALGQEEFTVAHRVVAAPGRPEVRGDVHPADVEFTVCEVAVGILERRLPGAERLDLRSDKHDPGVVLLEKLVVERRAPVADLYFALRLWHTGRKVSKIVFVFLG